MRKTGPLNKGELRAFQKRHKATVDGKFGHQSMGMVLGIEGDRDYYKSAYEVLKAKPKPNINALLLVTGSIAFLIGFSMQAIFG